MADTFGGLGGLGGFDFGNLAAALGQSLLTSPRYAPLQGLPAGIQAANKASEDAQSRAAMAMVAQKLGIDPRMAANPQAMSLLINANNQQQNMDLAKGAMGGIDSLFGGAGGGLGGLGGAAPAPARTSFDSSSVPSFVTAAGSSKGISPDYMARTAYIESKMDPTAVSPTGASGLFQFTKGTARQYGLTDPTDPVASSDAAARLAADNKKSLTAALGREPTDPELYLAHQQGAGGAAKLLSNPNARAGDLVGDQAVRVNGGNPNMKAGEFANLWISKYNSTAPRGVQTAQAATATATDAPAPYKVAAAGGAIPVPLQRVPDVPPPHPNTAGDGTTTQKTLAQQQAKWGMKMMLVGGVTKNEGLVAAGKEAFALGSDYLKTPEMIKLMQAAGMSQEQQAAAIRMSLDKRPDDIKTAEYAYPGQPDRARQAVAAGLKDNRPEVVRLGEHAQDSPGLVKSGQEALAAQKGAETAATNRATALGEESSTATAGGRQAQQLLSSLDDAQKYFQQAAKGGGTGPAAASSLSRGIVARAGSENGILGTGLLSQSYKNEVARQNFDKAIAAVRNAKSAINLKGQGAVSNFERTLAAADLPDLDVVSPEVANTAFARIRRDLQTAIALDKEVGLHQGKQPATTPTAISTPYGTIRQK
jgi:hypothetical protein